MFFIITVSSCLVYTALFFSYIQPSIYKQTGISHENEGPGSQINAPQQTQEPQESKQGGQALWQALVMSLTVMVLTSWLLWLAVHYIVSNRAKNLVYAIGQNSSAGRAFDRSEIIDVARQLSQVVAPEYKPGAANGINHTDRLNLVMEGTNDALWEVDFTTGATNNDERWYYALGLKPGDIEPTIKAWLAMTNRKDRNKAFRLYRKFLMLHQVFIEWEYRATDRYGQTKWFHLRGKITKWDAQGVPEKAIGIQSDITARKNTEIELERQALVIEQLSEAVVISNLELKVLDWNKGAEKLFGYKKDEIVGLPSHMIFTNEMPQLKPEALLETLSSKGRLCLEEKIITKFGNIGYCESVYIPFKTKENTIQSIIEVHRDITERKKQEKELKKMAMYDSLTGIPNRRLLMDRLSVAMNSAKRNESYIALMFIDLDDFKHINDTYGHQAGDEVLKSVAQKLEENLRASDTLGRLGGDEFLIIMNELSGEEQARMIASRIHDEFEKEVVLNEQPLKINISTGLAIHKATSQSYLKADEFIHAADTLMYRSKKEEVGEIPVKEV